MEKYILTIDEGTTSARAILFNHEGMPVSIAQNEFNQYYPHPGWIEQDPKEIWATTTEVINKCKKAANVSDDDILAVGITNQRETSIIWDKETGLPVYNAIVWGDNRQEIVDGYNALREEGYEEVLKDKTGLMCDPEFSALKVKWILDHVEGTRERAKKGELYFGNIDCWILWNLTRGKAHKTDYSNASRTALFNIKTLDWDQELLDKFDIPRIMMPEVCDSCTHFGDVRVGTTFQKPLPIMSMIGDQMAATFGQACFDEGECKMTFGTAGVFDSIIGEEPKKSESGLLTSIAWGLNGKITYLFEGVVFNSGSTIQYLRDELRFVEATPDSEFFAKKSKAPRGNVYFLPMFSGIGAPYWDAYAKGTLFGLTRGIEKNDIIKAALDSLGYQTRDMVDAVIKDTGKKIKVLNIDGGAAKNNMIAQFNADILGIDVDRPSNVETTAAGAAFMAGLGVGFWNGFEDIKKARKSEKIFKPEMSEKEKEKLYAGWKNCINALKVWGKGTQEIRKEFGD
jgi:glycerol kinase